MEILGQIVTFILILVALLGLFWTMFGIPLGIMLVMLKSAKKLTISGKKILLLTFGGLLVLVVSLILYFILNVVLGFFGVRTSNLQLPKIDEQVQPLGQNAFNESFMNSCNIDGKSAEQCTCVLNYINSNYIPEDTIQWADKGMPEDVIEATRTCTPSEDPANFKLEEL